MRTQDENETVKERERDRGERRVFKVFHNSIFIFSATPPLTTTLLGLNFLGKKGPTGVATLPLCWPANCASGLKC